MKFEISSVCSTAGNGRGTRPGNVPQQAQNHEDLMPQRRGPKRGRRQSPSAVPAVADVVGGQQPHEIILGGRRPTAKKRRVSKFIRVHSDDVMPPPTQPAHDDGRGAGRAGAIRPVGSDDGEFQFYCVQSVGHSIGKKEKKRVARCSCEMQMV